MVKLEYPGQVVQLVGVNGWRHDVEDYQGITFPQGLCPDIVVAIGRQIYRESL